MYKQFYFFLENLEFFKCLEKIAFVNGTQKYKSTKLSNINQIPRLLYFI